MDKSIANQATPSQVSGRLATWHRVMEEAGLTYADLQTPIDDPEFRRELIGFWQRRNVQDDSLPLDRARTILGQDFHDIDAVEAILKHRFSNADHDRLLATVPDEAAIRALKGEWLLIADPGLSLLDLRQKKGKLFYSKRDAWYDKHPLASQTGVAQWLWLRKTDVPDSRSKNFEEQTSLLKEGEVVPFARQVALGTIVHFEATGERLFEKVWVRCQDVDSDGNRVLVGHFDAVGLHVNNYWDVHRDGLLGLAAAQN